MQKIIFLEPVFKEMIWGGTRLATDFSYEIPGDHTGECWAVSAHPNGDCRIKNGAFRGQTLSEVYKNHRELFGDSFGDVFPLLVKIIDAKADLSIQVHPMDSYAKEHENGSLGKTECWYILDCDKDATIVIGHHAKDKAELVSMIKENRWNDLIRVIPIKKGDFFQINPGCVHAIKAGTLILETQQNSDITYRLYDYDRLQNGKKRELHLEKSMDVITCPFEPDTGEITTKQVQGAEITQLVKCDYYRVQLIQVQGEYKATMDSPFRIFSVIEGSGFVDGEAVKKGDHFLLTTACKEFTLSGEMTFITSCPQ